MTTRTPTLPSSVEVESPPVAVAEARAVAPLRVAGIGAVAASRLMKVSPGTLLVEVASLLSNPQISAVVVDGHRLPVMAPAVPLRFRPTQQECP